MTMIIINVLLAYLSAFMCGVHLKKKGYSMLFIWVVTCILNIIQIAIRI